MNTRLADEIVDAIVATIKDNFLIKVEASGRHIHLSRKDVDTLFGKDYQLTKVKDLSQPGQFACKERVTITGPKGSLKNVVVLGPERKATQVEISLTDSLSLGIKAPIRQSGEIANTPGIKVSSETGEIALNEGLIVAKRHVHMTPRDAEKINLHDGEIIKVKILTARPLIFDDVVVRISKDFETFMHIDYDEANACGFKNGDCALIVK